MAAIRPRSTVSAWQPSVPGIAEVFHARFTDHAYPTHVHDTWALMILDGGRVDFALDRERHGVGLRNSVILLPPGVAHDGRTVTEAGFRKRVLYLDTSVLPEGLTGAAVDAPLLLDPALRERVHGLHVALGAPELPAGAVERLEAESRLAFVRERLHRWLAGRAPTAYGAPGARLAVRLRELLDARVTEGIGLEEASVELGHVHPTHLIRSFKAAYGLPPHAYLTGRRVELARRLLLAGMRPAEAATAAGFYDQAHLTRHFGRHVGTSPARFARSGPV
ncbi:MULTISPECIES: AraC family transcriptional regulator [Streptomyces]|uniref:AraC family transcriptional regulator n=1 Tax=Streptomyces virginiae TaxID=1961 RepID=A0ABZ1THF2_STRVG|nr:AraC family transcriptional regulator [Streptomyces virginiae]MCX4719314.1 AraC family transcriptional regulator [Streptomyces virginiae]MCX5271245.1 AraC family transcriptional regulator [Streptomyces virginiae]WTB24812.1 AraC family transcriptional regulator [Streptomyces virginiae]